MVLTWWCIPSADAMLLDDYKKEQLAKYAIDCQNVIYNLSKIRRINSNNQVISAW